MYPPVFDPVLTLFDAVCESDIRQAVLLGKPNGPSQKQLAQLPTMRRMNPVPHYAETGTYVWVLFGYQNANPYRLAIGESA